MASVHGVRRNPAPTRGGGSSGGSVAEGNRVGPKTRPRCPQSPADFFRSPKIFVETCQQFSFHAVDLCLIFANPRLMPSSRGKTQEAEKQIFIDYEVLSRSYRGGRTVFYNRIPDVVQATPPGDKSADPRRPRGRARQWREDA